MYILAILIVAMLAITLSFATLVIHRRPSETPRWMKLVNELRAASIKFENEQQLEDFLVSKSEEVCDFETDYNFLVTYNTMVRQIRTQLKHKQ